MPEDRETREARKDRAAGQINYHDFRNTVLTYYQRHGRSLAWRYNISAYNVFVSEIMLQQTQVSRVSDKFPQFIYSFPDFPLLAAASRADVLAAWQGLGYNRRALFLHSAAQQIVQVYNGSLPEEKAELEKLPGVGKYTACAIRTFLFNKAEVFIETNIRRAYLHHFFEGRENIADSDLYYYVAASLDTRDPRTWYYALMDYGGMLASVLQQNPNRKSKHYSKQEKFQGSRRQLRGKVLRILAAEKRAPYASLQEKIREAEHDYADSLEAVLGQLEQEGFLTWEDGAFRLST